MKKKIPVIFSISNKINIISIIIMFGSMYPVMRLWFLREKYLPEMVLGLVSIFIVYTVNFYLGLKLVHQYFSYNNLNKPKKVTRIIFFSIEIIFLCFHSFLIWISFFEVQVSRYFPLNVLNILRLATIVTLYISYISSLLRTIFMWPFFKMVNNKHFDIVDTIGNSMKSV